MAKNEFILALMEETLWTDYQRWVFNLKQLTWQYDITSTPPHDSPTRANTSIRPFSQGVLKINRMLSLPLESKTIIDNLQQIFLELIASLGMTSSVRCCEDLQCVSQDVVMFGAIIDANEPEILAHFPSVPNPEWYIYTHLTNHGVKAYYANLGTSFSHFASGFDRLDFASEVDIFVDAVSFILSGRLSSEFLHHNSARVHLFISTTSIERVSDMPCLHWPPTLESPLWYWSLDPEGEKILPAKEWGQYKIPDLKLQLIAGTSWSRKQYEAIKEYLETQKWDPYRGDQYARENGYEVMAHWDPHTDDVHLKQVEDDWVQIEGRFPEGTRAENNLGSNLFISPSVYSLISQSEA
ncbi:hypothetical protein L218DRAFT_1007164 [Marasmius fiardii PR-910]|nr:hypothetical protein L218DRAFT_1007164 [Marasmius fiardii PR-910]